MTQFITKLNTAVDLKKVVDEFDFLRENIMPWNKHNQIGLRHRANCIDQWQDAVGSLFVGDPKKKIADESDFSNWNDKVPEYTKNELIRLADEEGISWGRIRFMRLLPKTGLSVHLDTEPRYHLALRTTPTAIFSEFFKNDEVKSIGYHIPADGHWYKVDTTREHFVFNGSLTQNRVHLVCCPII